MIIRRARFSRYPERKKNLAFEDMGYEWRPVSLV